MIDTLSKTCQYDSCARVFNEIRYDNKSTLTYIKRYASSCYISTMVSLEIMSRDIDNDEPSFYIVINNNSNKEAEIKITLNYDHTSLRVDGGSIFKEDNASFKLTNKNGGVENIGINVSCSKDTTDIYSLISKVVFNNKIKFERSTIIETIKIGKSEIRRAS